MIDPVTGSKLTKKQMRKFVLEILPDSKYSSKSPLYITVIGTATKEIDGKLYSPLLQTKDIGLIDEAISYQANCSFWFLSAMTSNALITALIPVFIELSINPIFLMVTICIPLLWKAWNNFRKCQKLMKSIGEIFKETKKYVPIPEGVKKKALLSGFGLFFKPASIATIGEIIGSSDNEEIKLTYDILDVGFDQLETIESNKKNE